MDAPRAMLDFADEGLQLLLQPRRVLQAERLEQVRPLLREAEAAAQAGAWVVLLVAYEAAPAFDDAHTVRAHEGPVPLAWAAVFDAPQPVPRPDAPAVTLQWMTPTSRDRYDVAIRTIRDAIAAGDVYQVNHTLRFHARCDAEPAALFHALAGARHGRYHALIETAHWAVVSASPELFFERRDGRVSTRPMKGTLRRGRWREEDERARATLFASAKDRAENLMIVDLLRNDMGRIAEFGSVHVPALYDVETYPTVHQMTSTVTGRVRDGTTIDDIFAAMFPCGSITGAPKFTAMQRIAALEDAPRGAYCGAIGVLRPDGSATFNVAIRTVTIDRVQGSAVYGSGGGITWDSSADAEYDEAVAKAALLTEHIPPFELLETMRCDDGVVARLPLHLGRLADSAAYWGFDRTFVDAARAAIERASSVGRAGERSRLRLTVARDGTVRVTTSPLDTARDGVQPVMLASSPVSRHDRLLFHKTTARAQYDRHRAEHPDAFDVLLHNEQGEVTEFTIGSVVAEIDGVRCTPPLDCGLLPGVFRAELLRAGAVVERVLTLDDVRRAPRLWLVNSVREWVEVALA